jgi:hypothetical protein
MSWLEARKPLNQLTYPVGLPNSAGAVRNRVAVAMHWWDMSNLKKEDTDKQGGWLVRLKTPQSLDHLLCVYELDWAKAKDLPSTKASATVGATVEAVGPVNVRSLIGLGMMPGDLQQHD